MFKHHWWGREGPICRFDDFCGVKPLTMAVLTKITENLTVGSHEPGKVNPSTPLKIFPM